MTKKKVSVVITDLDNTLYDWFKVWHLSFRAMLDQLVKDSGIAEEILISEIKAIHEEHGTAEYSMLINELPSLRKKDPKGNLTEIYQEAIKIYRDKRKENLQLYPGVLATLLSIKKSGCLTIGYTDSQSFYTTYRIKELGLDGVLDFLYSSPNHSFPSNPDPAQIHFYPSDTFALEHTVHSQTPEGTAKPSPEVLLSITKDIGAPLQEVIYVGDSLNNDIAMAKAVPVTDVFAKYGASSAKQDYELLRKVTHWKTARVNNEKVTTEEDLKPTYILQNSFTELLDLCDYQPFTGAKEAQSRIPNVIKIWEKTIDVQQHFNDLELRIRSFALTVLGVILSASAVALKEASSGYLPVFLLLVAIILWGAFYLMDRHWYHRLLIGAVKHGEMIEKQLATTLPEIALTASISKESPSIIRGKQYHTGRKMNWFYGLVAGGLVLLMILFGLMNFFRTPARPEDANPKTIIIEQGRSERAKEAANPVETPTQPPTNANAPGSLRPSATNSNPTP